MSLLVIPSQILISWFYLPTIYGYEPPLHYWVGLVVVQADWNWNWLDYWLREHFGDVNHLINYHHRAHWLAHFIIHVANA